MKTPEQLQVEFDCTPEMREDLAYIQMAGYEHGAAGWYPLGDFSSDADWCYGIGEKIARAETTLDLDDGSVFDLYREAHAEGMAEHGMSEMGARD